jgi:hypothetical protein
MDTLWRPLDPSTTRHTTVERWSEGAGGQTRVRGNQHLKESQAYPSEFGHAVGTFFANSVSMPDGIPIHDLPALVLDESDTWPDACLDDVLRDLDAV